MAVYGHLNISNSKSNPAPNLGISSQAILSDSTSDINYAYAYTGRNGETTITEDENVIVSCSGTYSIFINTWPRACYPIAIIQQGNKAPISQYICYLNSEGIPTVEPFKSHIIPLMTIDSMVQPVSSINLSTVDPNTSIEALVDGIMTEINNTPKTVNITDGNVVIDVASHSPKDKYTVQLNNGNNMLQIIDGSTQYNSFPASIPVETNKTLTAYGEPDKEITINYTNTGTPVITNT